MPVRAGDMRTGAELLGSDDISQLVTEVVDACRADAADRAAVLRQELAAAEEVLAQYDR